MRLNEIAKGGLWVVMAFLALVLTAGISFADDEADGWTGNLAVSVTAQSGTTDTFSGSIDASGERDWDKEEVGIRFNGVYGTSRTRTKGSGSTATIQNAQGLYGDWKHLLSERFFWDSGAELSRDNTQDRELRAAISTGPGYRAWEGADAAKHHFDISFGVGYRFEIYDGNTGAGIAQNGDTDHFADIVAGFEYKNLFFDDRIEYTHTGKGRVPANDTASYIVTSEAIIGVPLTEAWSFRTSFWVEYVANPGTDEVNNTTTRTTVGLGYKF